MDYKEYEKYMIDRKAVKVENDRRIEKKFAECEKWVADNLINSGCVYTKHAELLTNVRLCCHKSYNIIFTHNMNSCSTVLIFGNQSLAENPPKYSQFLG